MTVADTVFLGGAVLTATGAPAVRASAVAVHGGRIVAVGLDEDVREHVGPRTEVVDLAGRLLLPGFQDAHAHPLAAGVDMLRCDLNGATSAAGLRPASRSTRSSPTGPSS